MEAVEAAHVFAVGAGFAAEASGIGTVLDRKVAGFQDGIAVDVGDGHFGGGDEVEVVEVHVVHLCFLVGQLSGGISGGFVHHVRRFHFAVAVLAGGVEEEVDEGALHLGAFAFINGESGAGDLDAQLEVDDVVFLYELPVGKGGCTEGGGISFLVNHLVVLSAFAAGNGGVWHVRQQHHQLIDLAVLVGKLGLKFFLVGFELGGLRLHGLGFVAFALLEQLPNGLGQFALFHQIVVQGLFRLTNLRVDFKDIVNQFRSIKILNLQSFNYIRRIFTNDLYL